MTTPYREQAPPDAAPRPLSWWQRVQAWWSPPPHVHEWQPYHGIVVNEQPPRRVWVWVCRCGSYR